MIRDIPVKKRIKLLISVVLVSALLFGVTVLVLLQRHQQAMQKSQYMNRVVLEVSEREILADQYIVNPSERSKDQWHTKQRNLNRTLSAYRDLSPSHEETRLIAQIRKNLANSENAIKKIFAISDNADSGGSSLDEEKQNIYAGRRSIDVQMIFSDAAMLKQINDASAEQSFRQIVIHYLLTLVLFLILLLFSLGEIWRSTSRIERASEFLSIASHQLRTPVTIIKQNIGMMLAKFTGEMNPDQEELIKDVYESNERQIKIINDLLEIARVDAGKIRLKTTRRNIVQIVRAVIEEQSIAFKVKNQSLDFETKAEKVMVDIDEERVRMAFENILDNARKYTPEKKRISVSILTDAREVHIHVKDEGVGIKKRDISRIFEKFSRVDHQTLGDGSGTGLGLYWARKVIVMHGGDIDVVSKPGEGSLFTIRLPLPVKKSR